MGFSSSAVLFLVLAALTPSSFAATPAQPADSGAGKSGMAACTALIDQYDLGAPLRSCPRGDKTCFGNAIKKMDVIYKTMTSQPSWHANNCSQVIAASAPTPTDKITAAENHEVFIVNGNRYRAKTHCIGHYVGDPVTFIDGNRLGSCVAAKWVNKRNDATCEVWCE